MVFVPATWGGLVSGGPGQLGAAAAGPTAAAARLAAAVASTARERRAALLTSLPRRHGYGRGGRGRTGPPSLLHRRRWRSVWSTRSERHRPRTRRRWRS